jgi:predicted PurR-regulated permease PerM
VWKLFAPFGGALALAAIIVTICYPLYERILKLVPKGNKTVASLLAVLAVICIVVVPLFVLGTFLLREALSVYSLVGSTSQVSFGDSVRHIETIAQRFIPGFSLDIESYVKQTASFVASHLVSIFAGTASTIFLFFLALIASFYFFRDGKEFTKYLVEVSPLKDGQDSLILRRVATAVRSVALGTVLVALIQGTLTGIGLAFFGFDRAILWGCVAAIGALIPGVGTTIVFVPSVIYLIVTGSHLAASGVALWGVLAVGIIDNMVGPYFMSRGNPLHPFLILLSVLGGIALFGPIGFILGPVIISFFTVLIELYGQQLRDKQ